jgi:hypothetical protein
MVKESLQRSTGEVFLNVIGECFERGAEGGRTSDAPASLLMDFSIAKNSALPCGVHLCALVAE